MNVSIPVSNLLFLFVSLFSPILGRVPAIFHLGSYSEASANLAGLYTLDRKFVIGMAKRRSVRVAVNFKENERAGHTGNREGGEGVSGSPAVGEWAGQGRRSYDHRSQTFV